MAQPAQIENPLRHLTIGHMPTMPDCWRFLDYWLSLRGGAAVPLRRDFDPFAFPELTPDLVVLEHQADRDHWVFRVIGTGVSQSATGGRNKTGQTLEETDDPGFVAAFKPLLADCLAGTSPLVLRGPIRSSATEHRCMELVLMPLAEPDGRVRRLVGLSSFFMCADSRG